jgi:hypothetical protein
MWGHAAGIQAVWLLWTSPYVARQWNLPQISWNAAAGSDGVTSGHFKELINWNEISHKRRCASWLIPAVSDENCSCYDQHLLSVSDTRGGGIVAVTTLRPAGNCSWNTTTYSVRVRRGNRFSACAVCARNVCIQKWPLTIRDATFRCSSGCLVELGGGGSITKGVGTGFTPFSFPAPSSTTQGQFISLRIIEAAFVI